MRTILHFPTLAAAVIICGTGLSAQAQEDPKDIIAAHIRMQGYTCDKPQSAVRNRAESRPDEPVWVLKCEGNTYRVRLIPDMAAQVQRMD